MIYNFDELSFTTLSVDRFKHSNGLFNVAPRPFSALSFRVCGEADFRIGDSSFHSEKGDILFIPAGLAYTAQYTDSESIAFHIYNCNYTVFENIKAERYEFINGLFEELLNIRSTRRSSNIIKSEFFSLLQKIDELQASSLDTNFLKCVDFVQSSFTDSELSVSAICRIGNLSVSGLYRRFCSHFGLSPKQYILKLRINYALELLAKGYYSVKEVAAMSGFSDEKYFSRLIKARLGKPPSDFI